MKFTTIATPATNPWKRIKFQYVTAVAGAALALSGAIAVGSWQGFDADTSAQSERPAIGETSVSSRVAAPQVVYYFVSSKVEADRAEQAEWAGAQDRELLNAPLQEREVHILMLTTEAQENVALRQINEASRDADGVAFYFVDLRGR